MPATVGDAACAHEQMGEAAPRVRSLDHDGCNSGLSAGTFPSATPCRNPALQPGWPTGIIGVGHPTETEVWCRLRTLAPQARQTDAPLEPLGSALQQQRAKEHICKYIYICITNVYIPQRPPGPPEVAWDFPFQLVLTFLF